MTFKKLLMPVICFGLIGAMGTGCDTKKEEKIVVDTKSLLQSGKNAEESAENLALAGEQLVSPISFMYADIVFDLALKVDANNKRAQFYKALIKPMMSMKGLLNRVVPVVGTLPEESQKEYNESLAKMPESSIKTFLLEGEQDIKTEEDTLKFLDEYRAGWEEIRQFMKNNKDLDMDINIMTLPGVQGALSNAAKDCEVQSYMNEKFTMEQCSYLKALKINISRADVEAIQHIAAGMQMYLIMGTSYRLDGLRDFAEKNQDRDVTSQEVIEHFKNATKAGTLRHKGLTQIPTFGTDLIAGARWALKIQDQLCPHGSKHQRTWLEAKTKVNRKGSLFEDGICIDKANSEGTPTENTLKAIEDLLAGGLTTIEGSRKNGSIVKANVRMVAPLASPVEDLRSLAPISYNKCGNAVALADKTIGGIFPEGDGNSYLKAIGNLDSENCE